LPWNDVRYPRKKDQEGQEKSLNELPPCQAQGAKRTEREHGAQAKHPAGNQLWHFAHQHPV
jgi:hypothetical protein